MAVCLWKGCISEHTYFKCSWFILIFRTKMLYVVVYYNTIIVFVWYQLLWIGCRQFKQYRGFIILVS